MSEKDYSQLDIENLRKENSELKKRVSDLEELVTKIRNEVTLIKQYEWGILPDPPTVKKEIC